MYKIDRRGGVQKSYTRTDSLLIVPEGVEPPFTPECHLKITIFTFSGGEGLGGARQNPIGRPPVPVYAYSHRA